MLALLKHHWTAVGEIKKPKKTNKMKVPVLPKCFYALTLRSVNYVMIYGFVARHGFVACLCNFCSIPMKIQCDFDRLGL